MDYGVILVLSIADFLNAKQNKSLSEFFFVAKRGVARIRLIDSLINIPGEISLLLLFT